MVVSFAQTSTARLPAQNSRASLRLRPANRRSLRANRAPVSVFAKASDATIKEAKEACAELVKKINCAPILVRLAWSVPGPCLPLLFLPTTGYRNDCGYFHRCLMPASL